MVQFSKMFSPTSQQLTFFESCGVADLITTLVGRDFYFLFSSFFTFDLRRLHKLFVRDFVKNKYETFSELKYEM